MKRPRSFRTIILAGSFLLQLDTLCLHSHAAAGDVDLSFDPGSGVNGSVHAVFVQPDGKVIIGGQFTMVRGLLRTNLARLNVDGSGDASFGQVSPPSQQAIRTVALQPDGRLIVAGQFSEVCDEWACYYPPSIRRLNADGTSDASFTPAVLGSGYGGVPMVRSLVLQPNGKVLVGGEFDFANGTNRPGIARLNSDGSLDSTFNPQSELSASIYELSLQADGGVLIASGVEGWLFFGATNLNGFGRLKPNGELDTGFSPGVALGGQSARVSSLAVQPDGRILAGGYFTNTSGNNLLRLNSNGSVDTSFNSGTGPDGEVSHLTLQADGKVLLAGISITNVNGIPRRMLARLNANGSLDTTFDSGTNGAWARTLALQSDGKLLVGRFQISAEDRTIVRLDSSGTMDATFNAGQRLGRPVAALALQPDGKILIGGPLVTGSLYWGPLGDVPPFVSGTNRYGRARLNQDGKPDGEFTSAVFNPDLAFWYPDDCIGPPFGCNQAALGALRLVQSDGKVILGGFTQTTITGEETFGQSHRVFLGRYHLNGSLDTTFTPPTNTLMAAAVQQPDGKILMGGYIAWNGVTSTVARLNLDGSPDPTFQLGQGPETVTCLALQNDGKVIVRGYNSVVRLNGNGSRDPGFTPTVLSPSLRSGFLPWMGYDQMGYEPLGALVLQPDGKVLIGGNFTSVNGTNRNGIARLNANGSLDLDFNPGTGPDGVVRSLALQPDGHVLIGGDFTTVNGAVRPYVARLIGDSPFPSLTLAQAGGSVILSWPVTALNIQLQETTDLSGPNAWSHVVHAAVTNASQISVTVPTTFGRKFFRLKTE